MQMYRRNSVHASKSCASAGGGCLIRLLELGARWLVSSKTERGWMCLREVKEGIALSVSVRRATGSGNASQADRNNLSSGQCENDGSVEQMKLSPNEWIKLDSMEGKMSDTQGRSTIACPGYYFTAGIFNIGVDSPTAKEEGCLGDGAEQTLLSGAHAYFRADQAFRSKQLATLAKASMG